jgi:carbon storage regulator
MLMLARRTNQRIVIDGGRIVVTVVEIGVGKVRLGIDAPPDCRVDREEVHRERQAEATQEGMKDEG